MAVTRAWAEVVAAGLALLPESAARKDGGLGRRRVIALVTALPLPAVAVAVILCLAATLIFPARMAEALVLVGLIPEGLWWVCVTLIGALFGLRVQRQEQAFLQEATSPLPPPVAEADIRDDAALALRLSAASLGPNPALAAWRAVPPADDRITQS